jgi:hypothetical protein
LISSGKSARALLFQRVSARSHGKRQSVDEGSGANRQASERSEIFKNHDAQGFREYGVSDLRA